MRRILMQAGWSRRRGSSPLSLAIASLGLVLSVAVLISYNRGEPGRRAQPVPAPAKPTAVAPAPDPSPRAVPAAPPAGPRAARPPAAPRPETMMRPVTGAIVARHGWAYSRTMDDWRWHPGLDIAAPAGTTVKAAAPGRVQNVRQSKEWDWEVTIDHGGGVASRYAGCREVSVSPGQLVGAGEAIAAVGESALAEVENGAHLHFEVLVDGKPVDPMRYLK